jgi:hypothetical protein
VHPALDPAGLTRRQLAVSLAAGALGVPLSGRASAAVRDVARDAFVWAYPTVDLYAILHSQVLDPASPEYKAPLNHVGHVRQVATPADRAVIAPNVDTPYSYSWLDLRAEPVVVSVPPFEAQRYLSLQLFDLYTWIVGYVTPRTQGRAGGDYLVVPPGWAGTVPAGIAAVFRPTTLLALGMFRTQLLDAADLPNVHALQDRLRVRTLSAYLGRPGPPALPLPRPVLPLNLRARPADPAFFDVLNWMLAFMPVLPEEAALRQRFADIGIAPGKPFVSANTAVLPAVAEGMREGLQHMVGRSRRVRSSAELFGSRDFLRDDYLTRAVGAMLGILGNAAEEYLGVGYPADADGKPFDGRRRYRIRFAPDGLPPVDGFWSITVYTAERLLYANALQRQVINSTMLPKLQRDADGGLTLHLQHDSPGAALESNWLPTPAKPFVLTFRTYLPREAIRSGRWTAPPVESLP